MAASVTAICNMALSHLAVGRQIADITEDSTEAQACTLFYEQARDEVLRDFPWPFATQIAALALVATAPNTEWGYSYRYPATAVRIRRLLSGFRIDSNASKVPYRIGMDASGRLIFSDYASQYVEYTENVTDVTRFPPDYVAALSYRLAVYIAPMVTAGDPHNLGERAAAKYLFTLGRAQVNALNEEGPDLPPESEYVTVRG